VRQSRSFKAENLCSEAAIETQGQTWNWTNEIVANWLGLIASRLAQCELGLRDRAKLSANAAAVAARRHGGQALAP